MARSDRTWSPESADLDWIEATGRPVHPVLVEMEAAAAGGERIPILSRDSGRLLGVLAAGRRRIVEVGTAIGYSTLHMAEQLGRGHIVTLEIDPARAEVARGFFTRAGVGERVRVVEGDALETVSGVAGPIELLFLDAAKDEYRSYLELAEPALSPRALLVVDNVLMSGEVALRRGAPDTYWAADRLAGARILNAELLDSSAWVAAVLPIGDGIACASRR